MRYIVACDSTAGAVREINQDAVAFLQADAGGEDVVLAVLCDGMGGFSQGEFASTTVVKAYTDWFRAVFLKNTETMNGRRLKKEWAAIASLLNRELRQYGEERGFSIGTTLTLLLLWKETYYVFHVGDSRAYKIEETISQITTDHSVVAREVALGRITKEEARFDPRSNQILRSIGADCSVKGDFYTGEVKKNAVFLLCCDGVRNKVYDEELFYYFHPSCMTSKGNMENNIRYIFDLNISRGESDNMSLIVIKAAEASGTAGNVRTVGDAETAGNVRTVGDAGTAENARTVGDAGTVGNAETVGEPEITETDGQMIVNATEYIEVKFEG